MKKILILSLSVLSTLLFSACTDQANQPESQAENIIGKHTIRFTEPPKRIPAPHSVVSLHFKHKYKSSYRYKK